ncbi:MAG: hypothetical protein IPI60_09305 [Saprospiraceae bacterium]|nr:hypothetical protein [Saprospiraceae bacterium]
MNKNFCIYILFTSMLLMIACKQEPKSFVSWEISGVMYNGKHILEASDEEIPGKAIGMNIPAYDSVPAKTIITFEDKEQNWIVSMNIPTDSTEITLEKGSPDNFILTDTKLKRSLYPRGLKISIVPDSTDVDVSLKDSTLLNLFLQFNGEMFLRDSNGTEQIHQVKGELRFEQPVKVN